jgi:hypothetical protein
MSKKPVPSKRLSKDRSRRRHSVYIGVEIRRLKNRSASPYGAPAGAKDKGAKALEKITKIKA